MVISIIISPLRRSLNEKPEITVKKTILPLVLGFASLSFGVLPAVNGSGDAATAISHTNNERSSLEFTSGYTSLEAKASALYEEAGLDKLGLSFNVLKYALRGYEKLKARGQVHKDQILTVVDFSQSSRKKRMYIIDVENREVLVNTWVAHGKNTGLDKATRFSNRPESLQSSLGFYVTKNTYYGKHGLSLRLDGKERGYNDKAMARAIVLHGANYIGKHRLNAGYMGRSWGCPAVPKEVSAKVINLIKNGSCLFIYHPSNSYLHGSRLLNG